MKKILLKSTVATQGNMALQDPLMLNLPIKDLHLGEAHDRVVNHLIVDIPDNITTAEVIKQANLTCFYKVTRPVAYSELGEGKLLKK